MKKRLLGFVLCIMLTSICVSCGSEVSTAEQAETVTATEKSTLEQIVEKSETSEGAKESYPEVNTEPSKETAEESTTAPAETPAEEASAEQTETSAPETNTESVPEPQAVYTYTDMATTMYATQTVNIRNLPNTDGEKLGSLSINQEVAVTGQCNETGWYMFNYNGQTAFVSNSYLSVEKPEITPPANETPTTTNSSEAFPYELYVMYYDNMGYPYFYYIGLNSLYNTPENQAKEIACRDARSSYVFDHFEREDGCCSFNPYWGPVGKHKYQGDPIYVEFIDECNGAKLPAPESRGIYTAGLGW